MKLFKFLLNFFSLAYKKKKFKNYFYSFGGIDALVCRIFNTQKKGIYIDVGAQHPIRNNNTYLLHKKGWSGINIDLDKKNIDLFNIDRRGDENVRAAISSSFKKMDLYFYHDKSPINTLSKSVANYQNADIKEIRSVDTKTLNSIIENSQYKNSKIDFLSIDVEGLELEVLKGFDISLYKPKIIVIEYLDLSLKKLEIKNLNIDNITNSSVYHFMKNNNYILINWIHSDLVFAHKDYRD